MESDDSIFLPWAKDGCYTCKSAYRFLKEEWYELQSTRFDTQQIILEYLPKKTKT